MDLLLEMHRVAAALERAGIRYAICGGVAVTAYGAPRSTDDLDVLVTPKDIPAVLACARTIGYEFVALPLRFDEGTPQQRDVQRVTKVDGEQHLVLDLIHAAGPLADGLDTTVKVTLPDGPLRLVTKATLERMKRLAGRPKDLADLAALAEVDP